jgi:hypothetical protein
MRKVSIVVEGRTDAQLLRKILLKEELADIRFFAAQGRISLSTVARNIVVHEGCPVFVVMDADTLDEAAAEEARLDTLATIRYVAGTISIDAFAFVPEIEVVFFESPGVLERTLGGRIKEIDLRIGLAEPKRRLEALMVKLGKKGCLAQYLEEVDSASVRELRESKQMRALIAQLRHFAGHKTPRPRARR